MIAAQFNAILYNDYLNLQKLKMGLMEGISLSSKSLIVPPSACIVSGVIGGLVAKKNIKASKSEDSPKNG